MKKLVTALCLLISLQGCATSSPDASTVSIEDITEHAALKRETFAAGPFILTTYSRLGDLDAPVTIYIEGEDRPFAYTSAIELTPHNPVALKLAALDPSPNVVYIARPCQFTPYDAACDAALIKNGRFSKQVVSSVNRAVDHFIVPLTHPHVNLVGYGGGGAIAALIAAKRQQQADIASIRTIAGNMDPEGLARYEGYDGADDLLDPMPVAARVVAIPQIHFVGENDMAIPPFITANFLTQTPAHHCSKLVTIPNTSHDQGWEKMWESHVAEIPVCGKDAY